MKRAGVASVFAVFAFSALALVPAAHAQVAVQKTGWWTRSPAPPAVPAGGLAVGEAPDGYLTVSAFQVDAGGGATNASLSLAESDGQGQQGASIQACTSTDQWNSANGGELGLAPRPNCPTSAVLFTRDSNGVWAADINSLLAGKTGMVTLMVVPAPDAAALPGGARTGAFQISFKPPAVAGTVAPAAESESSADTSSAGATDTAPATTFSPAFGAPLTTPGEVPSLAAAPPSTELAAPAAGNANANVNFPVRVSGTPQKRAKSRLVILAWLVLASAIGAVAGVAHWARSEGVLARVLPVRRGGGLLPPAG